MTDPSRRDAWGQEHPGTYNYPADPSEYPAYSGESYGRRAPSQPTYQAPAAPNPTQQLPAYSPYGYDPYGRTPYGPPNSPGGPPPEPPEPEGPGPRRWLWILAAVALLIVLGLAISLVIVNSSQQQTVVSPSTPLEPSLTRTPTTTRTPSTTPSRTPSPRPSDTAVPPDTSPGTAHNVVYSVAGEGRAISILYLDSGSVLQTEFNVALPWSKEVQLTGQARNSASVSIVNVGRELTCSITIDGVQTQQSTGTGLTLCTALGTR
jgi:Mycobacterium membrane protein